MNFVVYCVIFHHIYIISIVISLNYNDFEDFPKDPLYFGYNSAEQENPILCIFLLSGTFPNSKVPGIFTMEVEDGLRQKDRRKWPREGREAHHGVAQTSCRTMGVISFLDRSIDLNLSRASPSWPKNHL
jgi:hypothetical protein